MNLGSVKDIMFIKRLFQLLILIYSFQACVEPFEIKYKLNRAVFSIDAQLSDKGIQKIQLSESRNETESSSISITPVKNASVEVLINNSTIIKFTESKTDAGTYFGPLNFVAVVGQKYQLKIIRENGIAYQSDIQQLPKYKSFENSIKTVTQIDEIKEIKSESQLKYYNGFHNIYLDFKDETGFGDNYSWSWKLFESNLVCKSCGPKKKYNKFPFPGDCTIESVWDEIFDYYCDGSCWKIYNSTQINIFNDQFSDGKIIKNRFIASIPYYQYNRGALIQIKQKLISDKAYYYDKIILQQNENAGGLADTPPVAFVSNILPLEASNELISGHFNVCFEVQYNFWIDRTSFLSKNLLAPGLNFNGRRTNIEKPEPGAAGSTPPTAPCLETYTSTKIKPEGWVEN